ncbi:MAG: deoxyribonuclease IV [Gemmatimonadaceae bacterium]|nr:deoxyribonuclease IV [Gemmatimonadaceae bacterium]
MPRLIGAHTIDSGGIAMAARRAGNAGMTALQVFSAVPKYYNEKVGVKPERVRAFHDALAEAGIAREAVIVHAGYVLNSATPEAEKWERAATALAKELERSTALEARGVCFHPGAATDGDREAALDRVAAAMVRALEHVPHGRTKLLVENSAGAGTTVGKTAAEVGGILARLPASLRARAGYGLDTCHLYASGYDLRASEAACRAVLDEFEAAAGASPDFLHLNDSQGALGSNKDRHMLLGEGEIGAEPFAWLVRDPRTRAIPLILETPQSDVPQADDDARADPCDLRMMALLRGFERDDAAPS